MASKKLILVFTKSQVVVLPDAQYVVAETHTISPFCLTKHHSVKLVLESTQHNDDLKTDTEWMASMLLATV